MRRKAGVVRRGDQRPKRQRIARQQRWGAVDDRYSYFIQLLAYSVDHGSRTTAGRTAIPLEAHLWLRRFLRLPFGLRTCGHPFASTKMSWDWRSSTAAKAQISPRSAQKGGDTILNLEYGNAGIRWGRLIFHVSDVDSFWAYLMEKGFHPDSPQDASWGERYFHMPDPDGHELSFARLI